MQFIGEMCSPVVYHSCPVPIKSLNQLLNLVSIQRNAWLLSWFYTTQRKESKGQFIKFLVFSQYICELLVSYSTILLIRYLLYIGHDQHQETVVNRIGRYHIVDHNILSLKSIRDRILQILQISLALNSSINQHLFGNLHRPPEVSDGDSHGTILVNVPKEIPQAQLALIQIILLKNGECVLTII